MKQRKLVVSRKRITNTVRPSCDFLKFVARAAFTPRITRTEAPLIPTLDFIYSRPETRGLRECRMDKRKVEGETRNDKAANVSARRAASVFPAHNLYTYDIMKDDIYMVFPSIYQDI